MKIGCRLQQLVWMVNIAMNLTGCLAPHMQSENVKFVNFPIDKNKQLLLSIGNKKRHYLYHSDYLRLEKFVKTAQPQETLTWRKYSMTYTLMSQFIFLDGNARPCRRYQFQAYSFLPFTESIHFTETACRCTNGQWQSMNSSH